MTYSPRSQSCCLLVSPICVNFHSIHLFRWIHRINDISMDWSVLGHVRKRWCYHYTTKILSSYFHQELEVKLEPGILALWMLREYKQSVSYHNLWYPTKCNMQCITQKFPNAFAHYFSLYYCFPPSLQCSVDCCSLLLQHRSNSLEDKKPRWTNDCLLASWTEVSLRALETHAKRTNNWCECRAIFFNLYISLCTP